MSEETTALWDIAQLFLKLGTTAFGGPAAHIAMLQREAVERCGWLSEAEFLDHLGASNLIPGPTSTELVLHIGRRRGGWPGLLVAGACFILPAALMVGILAWAYVRFGKLPAVAGLLYGVKPVVIAVVLQALWKLGRAALKTVWLAAVALIALGLSSIGVSPLLVLAVAAVLAAASAFSQFRKSASVFALSKARYALPAAAVTAASVGLWPIFLAFAKIGAMVFGSGYVLLVFLRRTGRAAFLANSTATARRCCRGAGHPRPRVYHRNLSRLSSPRDSRGNRCHHRHLLACIYPGRHQRPTYPQDSRFAYCGCHARRRQRRFTCFNGGCHLAVGASGHRRLDHRAFGNPQRCAAVLLPSLEFSVADRRCWILGVARYAFR